MSLLAGIILQYPEYCNQLRVDENLSMKAYNSKDEYKGKE